MIVLDACVLIAHLEAGHVHAAIAANILDTEEELAIHPLTLAELLVGAVRSGQENTVRQALGRIGIIVWHPDDEQPTRLARLRADTGLKLPDCCVLDTAQVQGAAVATFDDALGRAARHLGLAVLGH